MRIISIIVVLAIVYLGYGRSGEKQSPQSLQSHVAEAQREAAAVQPLAPQTPAAQPSGSLRAPIDRTRQVLGLVKQRNAE